MVFIHAWYFWCHGTLSVMAFLVSWYFKCHCIFSVIVILVSWYFLDVFDHIENLNHLDNCDHLDLIVGKNEPRDRDCSRLQTSVGFNNITGYHLHFYIKNENIIKI